MRLVRSRIGGQAACREMRPQVRHEPGQGFRRGGRPTPEHARTTKPSDSIDHELEGDTADLIRGALHTVKRLRRERPKEGERQMEIARVGNPSTHGQQSPEIRGQSGAHPLIGPKGEKPALSQGPGASVSCLRSPPGPIGGARCRDPPPIADAGSRLDPPARPRRYRPSRQAYPDCRRRVRRSR